MVAGLAVALSSSLALAQGGPTLGTPVFSGTGCPAGTAYAVLSQDATTMSILFDQYVAEAGRAVNRTFDRKSCNISVPVRVPNGYSVSIIEVDYRGFNGLPAGATSQFDVEYFFAGAQGPRFSRQFRGPLTDNYLLTNTLLASAVVWSACSATPILRANSSLRVNSNSRGEQAMATLDSADVSSSLVYHLAWRRCR